MGGGLQLQTALLEEPGASGPDLVPREGIELERLLADYERALLEGALERAGGVKKRAAALLGITFRSFRYRFEKLGLDGPDSDPSD